MPQKNLKPVILIGTISLILFLLAAKVRHPALILLSLGGLTYTYLRFRHNSRVSKRESQKLKRRESAIDIETTDLKESDERHVRR